MGALKRSPTGEGKQLHCIEFSGILKAGCEMTAYYTQLRQYLPALFIVMLAFIVLGETRLYRPDDESLYIDIARDMYVRSELWVPTWLGEHAFYKPPLTYWVSMAGFLALGPSLLAARIPIALLTLFTIYLVYLLGKDLYSRNTGILASLFTATSLGFISYGRIAMMDMPLCCVITLAMYLFHKTLKERTPLWLLLFFSTAGLSTLIKGPISFIIIMAACLTYLAILREWKPLFAPWTLWGGLLALFFIILWPMALYFKGCFNEWWSFFVIRENFGKFHDIDYPFYLIIGYFIQYLLPWAPLFISAIWLLLVKKEYRKPENIFILLWLLSILAVHMLPATKLKHYALPAVPPAALLIAAMAERYWNEKAMKAGKAGLLFLLAIATGVNLALLRFASDWQCFLLLVTAASASGAAFAAIARKGNIISGALAFCGALIFLIPGLSGLVYDRLPPSAMPFLEGRDVAVVRLQTYVYTYATGKYTPQLTTVSEFGASLNKGARILISETDLEEFSRDRSYKLPSITKVHAWNQWKTVLKIEEIGESLWTGSKGKLLENLYIVEKTPATTH